MRKLVIVGASGLGKEVAWIVERCNALAPAFEVLGFCDDAVEKQRGVFDRLPLLGPVESVAKRFGPVGFVCAVGNNKARQALTRRAVAEGHEPVTVMDPSAIIAPGVESGKGCIIGIGSVVSAGSRIDDGALVNHQVTVGHDVTLGAFAQLCPGVRVSGGCVLGEGALMGSNACTIPCVRVGAWATVGAGSVALRDIPDGGSLIRLGR
jgi:sugar O-acyltransferase (sialic acid O-acetyltransferase NeuD family)